MPSRDPFNNWLDLYDWIIIIWTWMMEGIFCYLDWFTGVTVPAYVFLILMIICVVLVAAKKRLLKKTR